MKKGATAPSAPLSREAAGDDTPKDDSRSELGDASPESVPRAGTEPSPRCWTVFYRLRFPSGRTIRKYVAPRGFTENWKLATRFTDHAMAERRASMLERQGHVVEETRELPAPDGGLFKGRSL